MPEVYEDEEAKPKFAQIYFYDGNNIDTQANRRYNLMKGTLNHTMLQQLNKELYDNNPFVHVFMTAQNIEEEQDVILTFIAIHNTHGKDMRNYNAPQTNEIAVLHTDYEPEQKRDILIKRFDDKLIRISELHGAYDPLQYPLLFPFGEYGWHGGILRANIQQKVGEKKEVLEPIEEEQEQEKQQQQEEETQQEYTQTESSQQLWSDTGLTFQQVLDNIYSSDIPEQQNIEEQQIIEKQQNIEEQQIVEKQQIVEEEQSVKKSVEKINPQETTSIDFESLYKERTQSQTGVTDVLEDVTLRSSTSMSISEEGEGSKSIKKVIPIEVESQTESEDEEDDDIIYIPQQEKTIKGKGKEKQVAR